MYAIRKLLRNPAGLAFVDDSLVAGLSLFMPDRHYSSAGDASPLFSIGPQRITSSGDLFVIPATAWAVITSYSIHYTKLYEARLRLCGG